MTFPPTRGTLIERLVSRGDEADWQAFLADYWNPICRFAMRQGGLSWADAEDVAAVTLEVLIANRLLARWVAHRAAKLRTLLCSVVRNILANRARVHAGRERLWREKIGALPAFSAADVSEAQVDTFYAAWAEELLRQVVETLMAEYHREGKGDYFRVLYGRVCEALSAPEIARALGLATTAVENYYKHARRRLTQHLEEAVRAQVARYCPAGQSDDEFRREWGELGDYLTRHGGLEQAVRRAYEESLPAQSRAKTDAFLHSLRQLQRAAADAPPRD
jgi:RNA polymerase sigma factor (sigma-70 family)